MRPNQPRLVRAVLTVFACVAVASRLRAQDAVPPRDTIQRTSIATSYEYDALNAGAAPWQFGSVSLGERAAAGSLIGRVNWTDRFNTTGTQYEADAYPHLGKGMYAYLNLGYSADGIFPRWRSGAELYTNLPDAFEASLGYRQLRFDGSNPVTLFTGTVGKYQGNYWVSLRPYVRQETNGTSASLSITGRRYYEDADHYIGARAGYGTTPTDQLTAFDLPRTHSVSGDVHGSMPVAKRLFATWQLGYEADELSASFTRKYWSFAGGLRADF